MKVAIEARALSAQGGVAHYVRELLEHLRKLPQAPELSILAPHLSDALVLPWLTFRAARQVSQSGAQVAHFTKSAIPRKRVVPTVVTLYDVIPILFPQGQALSRRFYWPRALAYAARYSDHILTISEASKRDIQTSCNVPADKITVTPLAVDTKRFTPSPTAAIAEFRHKHHITSPYILSVGTLEPRKNIPTLLRSFAKIAHDVPHLLVIIGRRSTESATIFTEIKRLNLQKKVRYEDFVPANDVSLWYSGADLFVFPSIYEGWGFPPQEAMACGTPVIVSDGGSLPEVVGSAGEVIPFTVKNVPERLHDSVFEANLAERMQQILASHEQQHKMRQAGLEHVQHFSWATVAQKTMDVYTRVSQL